MGFILLTSPRRVEYALASSSREELEKPQNSDKHVALELLSSLLRGVTLHFTAAHTPNSVPCRAFTTTQEERCAGGGGEG